MNNNLIVTRMKSIRQTVQVTNAQKLVASSHIGRARHLLEESAPYHDHIRASIANVLSVCPEVSSGFFDMEGTFKPAKRGVLVISADRGLAGGYNSNLMRFTESLLINDRAAHMMVLGRVGQRHLMRDGFVADHVYEGILDPPTFVSAEEFATVMLDLFENGKVDCFDIIYTHYHSSLKMEPMIERLFPLNPAVFGEPGGFSGEVAFEPGPEEVLSMMIPKYLKGYIYGCLVHAWTCELASRIAAMDNAMRNGNDMLDELALAFNRARQGRITQEITEIVAGASSMREDD